MSVFAELLMISIFLGLATIPIASSPDILYVDIAFFMKIA
ncbi:hypothetical protein D521_0413 [beta proteobacterium CB]|jgi:hypothetical protein|nr:hypothetical protein D521_0413 [beta proteobacterium CB]